MRFAFRGHLCYISICVKIDFGIAILTPTRLPVFDSRIGCDGIGNMYNPHSSTTHIPLIFSPTFPRLFGALIEDD